MSEDRQRGVDLFNEAWRLMETREDDDRLLHITHASRYHWGQAEECRSENLARGEWQVSRVYTVLGRPEPAIWHARRCLDHCEANGTAIHSTPPSPLGCRTRSTGRRRRYWGRRRR